MAGKNWSPRRGHVTREELIAWASRYYPEDAVAQSYNPETGESTDQAYDGLALFIVNEILSLYDWEGEDIDDEDMLDRVAGALATASGELALVSNGVMDLLRKVKKARKGKP